MGIRSKIKKRLPIFGKKTPPQASTPPAPSQPSYTPPVFEEPKSARGDTPVEEFIQNLVSENKVVLFMKGSPSNPMCGFSANAVGILSTYEHPFVHFNVLSDHDVREGVKDFSQWPTLPQIYIGGEFVGGSDILSQMHTSGELRTAIEEQYVSSEGDTEAGS